MIVIADMGATKTDWSFAEGTSVIETLSTSGFNPYYYSTNEIIDLLKESFSNKNLNAVKAVYLYGAGCSNDHKRQIVEDAVAHYFTKAKIEIEHDLLGSARALCGRNPGIACILGTGSNTCLYDGMNVIANNTSLGFLLALLVALPVGFLIGMSPHLSAAFNPFIQILKPISPLAWMPIALYTIKDSSISGVFVIFICSIWPMLINTAFGVASVRKELLNVAKTLEVSPLRKAFKVILPAAAPTILTGMRISMGIAWLVIVAAEMLVGGTGIGYFLWNEWNNLAISSVIFAIVVIGFVGMLLDMFFAKLQKMVTYAD